MRAAWLLACAVAILGSGCDDRDEVVRARESSASGGRKGEPPAPDRLAPGELVGGKHVAFGLTVPRQMKVDAHFPDAMHASGQVDADALIKYVRERVHAQHVELAGEWTIFPKAIVKGGDPKKLYRIEILKRDHRARLVMRDITPPPPPAPGLSDAERWRQAGMTPDGKPLDPQKLE